MLRTASNVITRLPVSAACCQPSRPWTAAEAFSHWAPHTGLDASQIGLNAAPLVCVQVLQDTHNYGALQALPGLQQKLLQKQMLGLEAQLVELQRTL